MTAADDLGPLPRGTYVCSATKGERSTARTGTPGYTVEFQILEGENTGRKLWRNWFFTTAALPYTKRDLQKFGIDSKAKLEAPFPANRMVFKVTVVIRKDDDGIERNEVKALELLRGGRTRCGCLRPRTRWGQPMSTPDYRYGFRVVGGVHENAAIGRCDRCVRGALLR